MRGTGYLAVAVTAIACALAPSTALAAFPGHDGLLALQPLDGRGVELVSAGGRIHGRICPGAPLATLGGATQPGLGCAQISGASWSPDGRELALIRRAARFGALVDVIYADGSCLACDQPWGQIDTLVRRREGMLADPSFSADGRGLLVTVGSGHRSEVVSGSFYGMGQLRAIPRPASDAVASSSGVVAFVREGHVLVMGRRGLRTVAAGTSPAWSPDGAELAYVRNGWVRLHDVATGTDSQLVRGSSPTWSPDGRELALIGSRDALETIPAAGGPARRLGGLRGARVAWQPLVHRPAGCSFPASAKVVASSRLVTVAYDRQGFAPPFAGDLAPARTRVPFAWAALGCLRSSSTIRLIASGRAFSNVGPFKFTGAEVGFQFTQGGAYGCTMGADVWLTVVNLADGSASIHDHVANMECAHDFDHLDDWLMSPTGALVYLTDLGPGSSDQFQDQWTLTAHDTAGVHVLDSLTTSDEQPPLTKLAINGDTASWDHLGSPRSAKLS